jgi:predicted Zn finger-like uncharacterized protein
MFTVCPKCTLTLAVTAADLRTGQGYVRCGRCLNVFNALLALSEEPADRGASPPVYSQADPASSSQITAALASSANDADEFEEAHPARVHMVAEVAQRNHLRVRATGPSRVNPAWPTAPEALRPSCSRAMRSPRPRSSCRKSRSTMRSPR